MARDGLDLVHSRLWTSEPLPRVQQVVQRTAAPDDHVDDHGIVHRLGRGIGAFDGEHGQHSAEDQKGNGEPGDGETEATSVERTRLELGTTPGCTAKDWHAPSDVVTGDGEGEQRRRSGGSNQTEQAEDDGDKYGTPDCADGDVAESFGLQGSVLACKIW